MSDGKNTVLKSNLTFQTDDQSSEGNRISRVNCIGTRNLHTVLHNFLRLEWRIWR